jgi:hypothetical protein
MALRTLGTTAQTSFTAVQFIPGMAPSDLATINAAIKYDNNPANNTIPLSAPSSLDNAGKLTLPGGRGTINLLPGDFVAVDPNTGWPIVISTNCAANGAIVHT